jgi:hypothetical protein
LLRVATRPQHRIAELTPRAGPRPWDVEPPHSPIDQRSTHGQAPSTRPSTTVLAGRLHSCDLRWRH